MSVNCRRGLHRRDSYAGRPSAPRGEGGQPCFMIEDSIRLCIDGRQLLPCRFNCPTRPSFSPKFLFCGLMVGICMKYLRKGWVDVWLFILYINPSNTGRLYPIPSPSWSTKVLPRSFTVFGQIESPPQLVLDFVMTGSERCCGTLFRTTVESSLSRGL